MNAAENGSQGQRHKKHGSTSLESTSSQSLDKGGKSKRKLKSKHTRDRKSTPKRNGNGGNIATKETGVIHHFTSDSCPVSRVTVYRDRAEVTRAVQFSAIEIGCQKVVVSGLSPSVDRNSIRVGSGKGDATILEVSYSTVLPSLESPRADVKEEKGKNDDEVKVKIEKVDKTIKSLSGQISVVKEKQNWVNSFASTKLKPRKVCPQATGSNGEVVPEVFRCLSIEEANSFLDWFRSTKTTYDDEILSLTKLLGALKKERDLYIKQSNVIVEIPEIRRVVTITLAVQSPGEMSLDLSYVVRGASWESQYDVRVKNDSSEGGVGECNLVYYGSIKNATGEDWKGVDMSLSTANPSLGGSPPPLAPLKVVFGAAYENDDEIYSEDFDESISMESSSDEEDMYGDDEKEKERDGEFKKKKEIGGKRRGKQTGSDKKKSKKALSSAPLQMKPKPKLEVLTAAVEQSSTSAIYHIHRKATVMSDNKPHKVTISQIELETNFTHVVVPTRSQNAFVKAVSTNCSGYHLLEGAMNVFMDNFFVTTSRLKNTSPGEQFTIYLGVDKGIVVDLKPIVSEEANTGFVKKSRSERTKHITTIRNSKKGPANVVVYDQLPYSSTKDIHIKVEIPNLKNAGPEVVVDEFHIISWEFELLPGKRKKVELSYVVEYPRDKVVVANEKPHLFTAVL